MASPSDFDAEGAPEEIVARLTMFAYFGNDRGYVGPEESGKQATADLQADIRWLLRRAGAGPEMHHKIPMVHRGVPRRSKS